MQVGNEALVLSAVGVIGLGCQWFSLAIAFASDFIFVVGRADRRAIYAVVKS